MYSGIQCFFKLRELQGSHITGKEGSRPPLEDKTAARSVPVVMLPFLPTPLPSRQAQKCCEQFGSTVEILTAR
jgi:hypothetical protein